MTPTARAALAAVSEAFGVPVETILSLSRKRGHAEARWAVMTILRDADYSQAQIGRTVGRDRTTVKHALETAMERSADWRDKLRVARRLYFQRRDAAARGGVADAA
jgi:chromosomal replication initiation ATPase DnaA